MFAFPVYIAFPNCFVMERRCSTVKLRGRGAEGKGGEHCQFHDNLTQSMLAIGDVLDGKYEIIRLLGEGGMGAVYEARHARIGKRLAIKLLRPELAQHPEAAERFTREAEAAAAIGHPGIIDIHDLGVGEGGAPYLVMEHLEGESFAERIDRQGMLPLGLVTYVGCQVLSALDAAHAAGIIHRDLKPDNLFLVDRRQHMPDVKLLDFGISMFVDTGGEDYRLTQTGQVLGTPYYMSPEQTRGVANLDLRTDLYSLGVILFEAVTAKVPFTGNNLFALVHSIQSDSVIPPSQLRDDVPDELEHVIERALAKDPDDRYATAAEMLMALQPLVDEQSRGFLTVARLQSGNLHVLQSSDDSFPSIESPKAPEAEISGGPWSESAPGDRPSTAPTVLGPATADKPPAEAFAATDLSASDLRPPRRQRRSPWLIVAALGVTIGLGSGLSMLLSSEDEGDAAQRNAAIGPAPSMTAVDAGSSDTDDAATSGDVGESDGAAPNDAAPSADEPAELVVLTLEGQPEGANMLLDGVPFEGAQLRRERSEGEHTLRVEFAGHRPWEETITFRETATIEIALEPRRRGGSVRPSKRPPRSAESLTTAPRPLPTPPPGPTPTKRESPRGRFGSDFE